MITQGPKIIKSSLDDREYKLFNLPNKMRCLLVSDKEADKSAAAIDVHVGSALDPRTHYGAAHFLEHMLF
jgi:secreted Zn-dependent insulinase-like peptidase